MRIKNSQYNIYIRHEMKIIISINDPKDYEKNIVIVTSSTYQREAKGHSSDKGSEDDDYTSNSSMVDNYIKSIRIMSKGTSHEYLTRLNGFNAFIKNEFGNRLSVDDLVTKIKEGEIDAYGVLSKFSGYLLS